jgi:hypothetical protein
MGSLHDCTWILGLPDYRVVAMERQHDGPLVIEIERRGIRRYRCSGCGRRTGRERDQIREESIGTFRPAHGPGCCRLCGSPDADAANGSDDCECPGLLVPQRPAGFTVHHQHDLSRARDPKHRRTSPRPGLGTELRVRRWPPVLVVLRPVANHRVCRSSTG